MKYFEVIFLPEDHPEKGGDQVILQAPGLKLFYVSGVECANDVAMLLLDGTPNLVGKQNMWTPETPNFEERDRGYAQWWSSYEIERTLGRGKLDRRFYSDAEMNFFEDFGVDEGGRGREEPGEEEEDEKYEEKRPEEETFPLDGVSVRSVSGSEGYWFDESRAMHLKGKDRTTPSGKRNSTELFLTRKGKYILHNEVGIPLSTLGPDELPIQEEDWEVIDKTRAENWMIRNGHGAFCDVKTLRDLEI